MTILWAEISTETGKKCILGKKGHFGDKMTFD